MDQNEQRREHARAQVAFTDRISAWLRRSGVQDADVRATLAVGLADFLDAARTSGAHLEAMLSEDPTHPASADFVGAMIVLAYILSRQQTIIIATCGESIRLQTRGMSRAACVQFVDDLERAKLALQVRPGS